MYLQHLGGVKDTCNRRFRNREHGLHLVGVGRGEEKKKLVFPRGGSSPAWAGGWSQRPRLTMCQHASHYGQACVPPNVYVEGLALGPAEYDYIERQGL